LILITGIRRLIKGNFHRTHHKILFLIEVNLSYVL
jgi:hypothetical protein